MTNAAPLTLEQLRAKMLDPNTTEEELRPYFTVDPERGEPFAPQLTLNTATVTVSEADLLARGDTILATANWIARRRRELQFYAKLEEGYDGPIIVSEGDSWFQYPFLLDDVIDHLLPDYAIFSLDAGGDTLENIFAEKEYIGAIAETRASILMLSAGGNDLLAGGDLERHLRDYDADLTPEQHLLPSFDQLVTQSIQIYDRIFRDMEQRFPSVAIITHGYDRPIPRPDGRWLGRPMRNKGIQDLALQRSIAAVMIDRFNAQMRRLAAAFPQVTFVDNRGAVGDGRWHDELHPTNTGFAQATGKIADAIREAAGNARAPAARTPHARAARAARREARPVSAPPSRSTRRGISLHIGLNSVDPNHYSGWDGQLNACEFDAEDMERIAQVAGYETTRLNTTAATRGAVLEAITGAAETLKAGDMFFISYSGHGGQVPDFNGDELERRDETWCLYDGQLIDDELYQLWARFGRDVRILVVSDSCHSGTVIKRIEQSGAGTIPSFETALNGDTRVRAMPAQIAARVYRSNRGFYENIARDIRVVEPGRLPKELSTPLQCTVRLLSGCLDPQFSYDGVANGQFTGTLLEVWRDGRFEGSYGQFVTEIQRRMPANQTPNHWTVGQPNPAFDGQRPFQI